MYQNIYTAIFCKNTKILGLLHGCCFYKTPITWTIYFILSWLMLFIDEVYIAQGAWFMALRIINLDKHLKTGRKIKYQIFGFEISCFDEMKSYQQLDQYIFLDRVSALMQFCRVCRLIFHNFSLKIPRNFECCKICSKISNKFFTRFFG